MRRSERGANLVEAALVVPILILILAGVVDLGRAFYSYIAIANAAREGARAGARFTCLSGDATQRGVYYDRILASITNEVTSGGGGIIQIDPADMTITVTPHPPTACQTPSLPVTVKIEYPVDTIMTPMWLVIIGSDRFDLTAEAAMSRIGTTLSP